MSVTVTLAELADMAFGTANGGSPRVSALRVLLRGLLEHLHPQEAAAQAGEDERGLLEPVAGGKPCSLHQQRQPWLGRAEGQPSRPSGPPGTAEVPAAGRPVAEAWKTVQLKKRMEVTEERMRKVMDMLQEMLTTICSLKTSVEDFQEELQLLKDNFQKAGLDELRGRSVQQNEPGHLLQSILDQMKAEKAALEAKASQEELQHAMVQLSEMMQDVLQRMSLLEQDRQKALDKLLSKMDSKLDCEALAPLQAQLEQMWMLTQQCLCQGPCCSANRAAGFKRQLFDPMKCISCDRPLTVAPALHLVMIRKASQLLRPHPASAGSSNCLAQQLPGRESEESSRCSRASQGSPPSPAPLSTSSSLITICPCGDTEDFACENREADILGINGVVYKGRPSSLAASRTTTAGKDFPATKTPQPRSQHTTEMRRAPKYGSDYVSPYSCAATRRQAPRGASGRLPRVAAGRRASELARGL